jgi:nucleoid-associated protein YgaU
MLEEPMGIWNFVKDVGSKLFGATEAKAATADTLKQEAAKYGLDVSGIDLKVEGDKVVLSGKAPSTEELEKIMLAVGNTTGVAQVESNVSVAESASQSRVYEVRKGDTLWKIAEEMYGKGSGAKYNIVFEANKPMLSHPDKIYPGQILRIPPVA